MKIEIKIRKNANSVIEKLRKKIEKPQPKVQVGLWGTITYPDGQSVAEVGFQNAWGTEKIPARNFFESSLNPIRKIANHFAPSILYAIKRGENSSYYNNKMGMSAAAAMKNVVLTGDWVPNSPVTIAKKKSSRPLVDTGLMVASITYQLVNIQDPYEAVRRRYGMYVK